MPRPLLGDGEAAVGREALQQDVGEGLLRVVAARRNVLQSNSSSRMRTTGEGIVVSASIFRIAALTFFSGTTW
jgi:hypothetical protein